MMKPASVLATEDKQLRQRLATEVLELGEALFDSLIETAAHSTGVSEDEPLSVEEMSEAARQFFTALRLLLNLEEP